MLTNNFIGNIKSTLAKLSGQRIQKIGRAANMLWIGFGDEITYVNFKGKPVVKSKYLLHIQCNWEVVSGYEIILQQNDFNIPKDEASHQLFDTEQFGNSKFDKISAEFNADIKADSTYVVNFCIHATGGLELKLSNNLIIKIYPNSPSEGESWRFLMPNSDEEHIVVFEELAE